MTRKLVAEIITEMPSSTNIASVKNSPFSSSRSPT
jgi:hypothetical protein